MSRRIIIKGANFRRFGIPNVGDSRELLGVDTSTFIKKSTATQNWYFPSPSWQAPLIAGQTILGIKVRVGQAGNFQVAKLDGYSTDPTVGSSQSGTISIIETFTAYDNELNTYIFSNPVVIPNDGDISIGLRVVSCDGIYFDNGTPEYSHPLFYVKTTSAAWQKTTGFGNGFELLVAD